MSPARFGFQALLVLALIALVSWPEHRQLRAGAFWHARGPLMARTEAADGSGRPTGSGLYRIGYGSASEATLGGTGASALHRKLYEHDLEGRRRRTPDGVLALGGRLNAIVGYARTAVNSPIPFARVRLRNITTGAVDARGVADEQGRFAFVDVIPSGYMVELVDAGGNVIATSEPLAVATNELRETTVRASGAGALRSFGAIAPTAHEPVAAAASQGVSKVATPERCASPPCSGSTR